MQKNLTEKEMKEEIYRLAPFHHKVDLPYGLSTYVPEMSRRQVEYTRISNLVRHAFPALLDVCGGSLKAKCVLDVACNCGGFSVEASKLGAEYVFGFDSVDHYIDQANFIKRALGLGQVEFKRMDIDDIDQVSIGLFDVTFCFGILYHLENPIIAMKRIASVTKHIMLVDTNVMRIPFVKKPLWWMNMPLISDNQSRDVTTSLWRSAEKTVQFCPNESAVIELLRFLGFQKIEKIKPEKKDLEKRYYRGKRATFLALR